MKKTLHEAAGWIATVWTAVVHYIHGFWTHPEPMAVAAVGAGSFVVASVIGNGEHNDVIAVIGVGLAVLGAVEVSLSRRMRMHEEVEARDKRDLINEIRTDFDRDAAIITESFRAEVAGLRKTWERVMMQAEGQVAAIEAHTSESKLMRENVLVKVQQLEREIELLRRAISSRTTL